MTAILVEGLCKSFDDVMAARDVTFSAAEGEIVALLGPSGCGKTTTLRCIAGLETPTSGLIAIDGQVLFSSTEGVSVPAEQRSLGMVFQSYALWPHLTVEQNVSYGLRIQRTGRSEMRRRVSEVLDVVGLGAFGGRYPSTLSGGQQQRVALARSLVTEPRVMLLDEPLSNLDLKLRESMRHEIRQLIKRLGVSALFVTHDQDEAMAVADTIVLMEGGSVAQIGTGRDLYEYPSTRYVAEFFGRVNLLEAVIDTTGPGVVTAMYDGEHVLTIRQGGDLQKSAGESCLISVRPESVRISSQGPQAVAQVGTNVLLGHVEEAVYLGNRTTYRVRLTSNEVLTVDAEADTAASGDAVSVELPGTALRIVE